MAETILTNIAFYKSVADEAYNDMVRLGDAAKRPKPDGSAGWIAIYDPSHTSFKRAIISIVFSGIWLEAAMHILIVERFGKIKFKKYDFKSYEEKLQLLGVSNPELLSSVSRFRDTRKHLVHEKAYFNENEITFAQKEARNASSMITQIHEHFFSVPPRAETS